MHNKLEDVILVYTLENIQLKRLMGRDLISKAGAMYKIYSQMPIEEKTSCHHCN
ncbi:MAG: dephospho-CoA kinase [Proteobacteria bacterium]|nr:dephospho-CoA kinase [Pseudomonadota bacterium]